MVSFENLKYYETPYKHFVIDDFFNDSEIYKQIWNADGTSNMSFDIRGLKGYFDRTVLPTLLDKIEQYFGEVDRDVWIENINVMNHKWVSETENTDPNDSTEYLIGRGSHIDGSSKKYPMLIYFDDGSAEEDIPDYAGSFQLMDWRNPDNVVKTIDFKNNRAIVFESSQISYHKFWCRPKNRLNLNIPIVNDKNQMELTKHYRQ